jgi:hypothetical protein
MKARNRWAQFAAKGACYAKGLHPTLQCIPAFFGGHESRAHGQEELLTPQ